MKEEELNVLNFAIRYYFSRLRSETTYVSLVHPTHAPECFTDESDEVEVPNCKS